MKRTRFTDEQIIGILAEHEAGDTCARGAGVGGQAQVFRQQSSITARMRNSREAPKLSARKSSDQRALGCAASGIGVRDPPARLRHQGRPDTQNSPADSRYD
jgi:hypothetical protein